MKRCVLFWSGFSWSIGDLATQTEISDGHQTLHAAFLAAHDLGM